MSASTSCKARAARLLARIRQDDWPPRKEIRDLGETCPAEFFQDIVEPLADSFDATQAALYEQLMRTWIPAAPIVIPAIPSRVDTVYVLSRVTLGADIKIVSPILAAMKERFPNARIVFVANRKSAELFEADLRIEHLNADYPRSGPVSARIAFANELRSRLQSANCIVIDPDSRMTQLGLVPVCEPDRCFHFPSRTIGGDSGDNLTDLVHRWLRMSFGVDAAAYLAPRAEPAAGDAPRVAISLGVGENDSKRVRGDFEERLIDILGIRFKTIWVDRGAGGEEARRVTAAVNESVVAGAVRFWEGGFAGFTSIISHCSLYVGYDSAGQHAAAAAGVPLISIFAGAPSDRFRHRWSAAGHRQISQVIAGGNAPQAVLEEFIGLITLD